MRADGFGAFQPLLQRLPEGDTELGGDFPRFCIILSTRARVSGKRKISIIVALLIALIGLTARLPKAFNQISVRMSLTRARLQTGLDERCLDRPDTVAQRAVDLAHWKAVAADMADDPGSGTSAATNTAQPIMRLA